MRSLAFPSGARAGFNAVHIAAGGIRFSGVAQSAGFLNLLNGKNGTNTGTPTVLIHGLLGPATTYPSNSDYTTFTGGPSVTDTETTFAAILVPNTLSGFQYYFSDSGGDALGVNGNLYYIRFGGTSNDSGLTLTVGVPYFLAASANASAVNFAVMRLDNGKFVEATTASGTNLASTGTYRIATVPGAGGSSGLASVAAAMKNSKFMPAAALKQWAYDPWSFWYPTQT